jgi:hypothetical protein
MNMIGKAASCRTIVGIVTLALMVMLPWAAWGGSGPQTLRVEKPSVMENIPIMTDSEMSKMRGRFDGAFFGVIIDVGFGTPPTLTPVGDVTETNAVYKNGVKVGYAIGTINDNTNNVNWEGGFGLHNIHNILQINGSGQNVTGLVELNLHVPEKIIQFGRPLNLCIPRVGGGPF